MELFHDFCQDKCQKVFKEKMFKNHSESFPDCQNVFSQSLVFILFIYKVVAVTMNKLNMLLAGSQRWKQPKNVNFKPIIRGPKSEIFD